MCKPLSEEEIAEIQDHVDEDISCTPTRSVMNGELEAMGCDTGAMRRSRTYWGAERVNRLLATIKADRARIEFMEGTNAQQARAVERLWPDVWQTAPNDEGEGGVKWRAWAADLDMWHIQNEARIAELEKVVNTYPKTADGAIIGFGDVVWGPDHSNKIMEWRWGVLPWTNADYTRDLFSKYHSTRELAQAALRESTRGDE